MTTFGEGDAQLSLCRHEDGAAEWVAVYLHRVPAQSSQL